MLLATALAAGLVPFGVGQATAAAAPPAPDRNGEGILASVTLVTGDRVDLLQRAGQQVPRVRPGRGREAVRFHVHRLDGHLYVVPSDAVALIGRGKLDRRLFDVTGLAAEGYSDAERRDLPLLVQGDSAAGVARVADDGGGTVTRRLPAVDAVALRQPKRSAARFWGTVLRGSGMKRVWLDGRRKALLDRSVPQIGAPEAWRAGLTGEGVKVAVLDTGIDATHPDFAGRLGAVENFTEAPDANDTVGHGTHVASTIAGTGAASEGTYRGVAPDATLLVGKVCESSYCDESAILAGMQWAAGSGADVVNLSLGGEDAPAIDPLEQAVNDLTDRYGTLFVVAAGNEGRDETVSSPASADAALAVGAVDDNDQLAGFSSRGPRVGDGALKPEITAPGVRIVAANAKDGFLGEPGEAYTSLSGTSMATPHVAGAAAILAQQHPDWTAGQLKAALVGSAKTHPTLGAYAQGAGRVDVSRATAQDGYATPPVVSAGRTSWPHHDDEAVTRTVTYHNPTEAPVTYQLALRGAGPDGQPAPAGMFGLAADQVTVPAGGTGTVDVTVDTSVDSPDGSYSAWLTASTGGAIVTTPLAVHKEPESYDFTIDVTDRAGRPAGSYWLVVQSLDRPAYWWPYDPDGSVTLRLPAGRYHVLAFVDTYDEGQDDDDGSTSLLTRPVYTLDRNATLAVDARRAEPIAVTLPDPTAELALGAVGYTHRYAHERSIGGTVITDDFARVGTGHLGPEVPDDEMVSELVGAWLVPDDDGGYLRSPRSYHLAYFEHGHLMTGFARQVDERELAAVRTTYHAAGDGQVGSRFWVGWPVGSSPSTGIGVPVGLPSTRTEYVNTDGVVWAGDLWLEKDWDLVAILLGDPGEYRAGRAYRERWNTAAYGPGFTGSYGGVRRTGDDLMVDIPMYTDGAGHAGFALTDTASTVLYRNGEKLAETELAGYGEFTVPGEAAEYRLEVDATRSSVPYSTRVSGTWTFRSGHTTEAEVLPLMTVGFAPEVDASNRAEAGQSLAVPVTVRTAAGAPRATVERLTVEVSYDDGETWQTAKLTPSDEADGGWVAHLSHPGDARYVSLRAAAVDSDGNTVEQTVIRAYGLT